MDKTQKQPFSLQLHATLILGKEQGRHYQPQNALSKLASFGDGLREALKVETPFLFLVKYWAHCNPESQHLPKYKGLGKNQITGDFGCFPENLRRFFNF